MIARRLAATGERLSRPLAAPRRPFQVAAVNLTIPAVRAKLHR